MTVYSFFVLDRDSTEPDFEARSFATDEAALDYGKTLLRQRTAGSAVEVWDDALRLAHFDRGNVHSWADELAPW